MFYSVRDAKKKTSNKVLCNEKNGNDINTTIHLKCKKNKTQTYTVMFFSTEALKLQLPWIRMKHSIGYFQTELQSISLSVE
jgi:hypothetical protein